MCGRDRGRNRPGRRARALRASAEVLAAVLAIASIAPSFAWAVEPESEGDGSAPPGSVPPGLEEGPAFELGGEETGLGEVAPAPDEGEVEEPSPEEAEAPPQTEPPTTAGIGDESEPTPAASPPIEESALPPPSPPPAYAPEEQAGPTYEAAPPAPPVGAIRNEAIVAPRNEPTSKGPQQHGTAEAPAAAPETAPLEPQPPSRSREPVSPAPVAAPVAIDIPGSLQGKRNHTVGAGECLWSIAEAVLPAGAGDTEIAAEVARLWRLNAARIGTGDPDLVYVGTVLRLHR